VSDSGVFELLDTENIIADSVVFLATYNSVCGTKVDSAICIVYLRKPLDIVPIGDTTLCHNTSATFSANATGGNPNQYTYTWINKSDFSVRSANQVLDLKNVETDALMRLVVKDGCTSPYDSIDFNVQVLAPLDVSLQTSSICADSIRLEAVGEGGKSSNYRYTWAQDNNQVANTSNTLMVFPTKQMQVWVAIADDCTSDAAYDSILVDTRPKFELNFAPDSVCEPFSIVWDDYIAQSSVATIEWKERNEANYKSILESAEYTNGAYNFTFIATNSLGCSNTLNQDVFVKPLPDASFSWLPIEPDFDNPLVRFKAAARADETTWVIEGKRFAEITDSFRYTFNKVGEYAVGMVVMKDGCIDSAFQSLTFKDVFRYFDITAFTPNKDGLNDYFTPSLSGVQTYEYEVYNSWGEKIFVGNQNSGGWDGTFMGKAVPDGYYIIRLSAQKSNGTNFYTSGIIHLIR
jgi:gliding motility-associated-like protein